jgi:Kef-type K+ transport system membrane component KefB
MLGQLTYIALAAVLAPIVGEVLRRFAIPGVVIEILLGVLVGPQLLDLVRPSGVILSVSDVGLAMLMFLAGFELDLRVIRGRPLKLAAASWGLSVAAAAVIALILLATGDWHSGVAIGVAVTTTALGTLLPVVRDSGLLARDLGRHVLAVGSIGEFGPIVLIALLLDQTQPLLSVLLLVGFAALAGLFALAASRPWGTRITEVLRQGLHSSSQLPVRVSMLLIIALILLASRLGLDVLLGSFAAGIIVRIAVTARGANAATDSFRGKLEAIGFGLFVPVFFIISGAKLNLSAFGHHPVALLAIPLFLGVLVLVRGGATFVTYRGALERRERLALAAFSVTGLPLIVVITTIATDDGHLTEQAAAAMVTAGMLSVLIFPVLALRLLGLGRPGRPAFEGDAL